ncbi:hypothetical protein [Avibacterium endocarditidis]
MKKILIVHPALVIGGAEKVLLNYLKILGNASQPASQPASQNMILNLFF